MLLNSFSTNNNQNSNQNLNSNNDDTQPSTNNIRRQFTRQRGLSRLFNSNSNCLNNSTEENDAFCNNRISFSTILFFILIFLILFYRD